MPVKIRTWAERLNDFPDMQITTSMDIQMAMQAEIDELRAENEAVRQANLDCIDHFNAMRDELEQLKAKLWLTIHQR